MATTRTRIPVDLPDMKAGNRVEPIRLRRLEEGIIKVPIVGLTPLIPHKWSEKSLRQMRDKQYGAKVRAAREPKNPEEEAEDSCYWLSPGKPGMPAVAFKAAIVDATRFFDGLTIVMSKQLFFVSGEGIEQLVAIDGVPVIFESTPRNASGTPDLRYRMKIFPWSAILEISYLPQQIDPQSVVTLVDAAGRGGVGDWRPSAPKSKTGIHGCWRVQTG